MTRQNIIRFAAILIAAGAIGTFVFKPFKTMAFERVDSTLTACESARHTDKQAEACGEALAAHDMAISKYPKDDRIGDLWRDQAWLKGILGDYAGSMSDINTALELDPNSAWAWYWRGRLNMPAGNIETAIEDFRRSSSIDPIYCPPNHRTRFMKDALWQLSKNGTSVLDEAVQRLTEEDANKPNEAFLFYLTNHEGGPYEGARAVLDKLIQTTDRPEYLMFLRAMLFAQTKQSEAALEDLAKVTETPERYAQVSDELIPRIAELKAAGNSCATDELSARNRSYYLLYSDALELEVEVLADTRNWKDALVSVDELIAHRPQAHMPWTTKGKILEQLDRLEEAEASYKEAIRLARPENYNASHGTSPPLIEALFRLAAIYENDGRQAKTQGVWDQALSVAHISVLWHVQELMKNAGHFAGQRTETYSAETKAAVHACLNDATCTWESVGGSELR